MGVLLLSVVGCGGAETKQPSHAPPSYRQRLGELKFKRDKIVLTISRLEKERNQIMHRLRSDGIESIDDLRSIPHWTVHARELKQVIKEQKSLKATVDSLDAAIVRVESILRRDDRERTVEYGKLSNEELNEVATIFHEVDETLKPANQVSGLEEIELQSLLEQELNNDE
ncbi:hypothetical protein [Planctomycetes bacterium SV_7m_r]|uniref:hypothetical protein n=1 Tax=Stieleria bergensis TaxID=2528025 RepID=UPI00119EE0CE